MKIPLSRPDIGEREIELVSKVLRSGQLSLGPRQVEFEREIAAYTGSRYAVAVNSGTSALHLCIRALHIGAGDEVLTTTFSFVASANCALYEGAVPAFVDIDRVTLNLDPKKVCEAIAHDYTWDGVRLRNRISGRTLKAILPVHVFGLPCDMSPILDLAEAFHLRVIEDACEALGASYHGQMAGTVGDAGVFAFYPNKQMTTAEGGVIVTNDARLASVCRSLRNQGRDENANWLCHSQLGYNYRLSELHCALGLAQLERIDELLAAREQLAAQYARGLAGIPQIALPCEVPGRKRSWFAYVVRLSGPSGSRLRQKLIEGLRERGIACQTYFLCIHRQPYFRDMPVMPFRPLPEAESASGTCLALPFFPAMTEEQVRDVCTAVREIVSMVESPSMCLTKPRVRSAEAAQESEQSFAAR